MATPPPAPTPKARHALCWALLAAAAGGACGADKGGNQLGGSIVAADVDLTFDAVDITSDGKALSIRYRRAKTGEIPCSLVVSAADGVDLTAGGPLQLDNAHFQASTMLGRQMAPGTASGATFPKVALGALSFEQMSLQAGQRVRGEFQIYFVAPPGYTLRGNFDGTVAGG